MQDVRDMLGSLMLHQVKDTVTFTGDTVAACSKQQHLPVGCGCSSDPVMSWKASLLS